MTEHTGSHDDESWLPVPVSGRPRAGQSAQLGVIEPVMFPRQPRRSPWGLRLPFRHKKAIPGLVADNAGIHAGGLFTPWDQIEDIAEPEEWHQHPRRGFLKGPPNAAREPGMVSGYALAISSAPPNPTLLLFQDDFDVSLTDMRLALLPLLIAQEARPTVAATVLPKTYPYMRGMNR